MVSLTVSLDFLRKLSEKLPESIKQAQKMYLKLLQERRENAFNCTETKGTRVLQHWGELVDEHQRTLAGILANVS